MQIFLYYYAIYEDVCDVYTVEKECVKMQKKKSILLNDGFVHSGPIGGQFETKVTEDGPD